ncbi:MAG: sensor histidine kinase [Prevotella sp.]
MDLCNIYMYVQVNNGSPWLTFLVVGLLFVAVIVSLFIQWNDRRKTREELAHLASMHKHGVEHELVLKAMKLATWRLDIATMTITFDSDFRAKTDVLSTPPGTPLSSIVDSINPADAERMKTGLMALCNGQSEEYHEQYRVKVPHNDKEYWSDSYATVAERDDSGAPTVIVGTSSCIDDAKRLEQELVDARNKAEESDRLKTSFIDNISHEVRTPLNAIVGFSDILTSVTDPAEREGLVAIIKENNQKLLNIFEEMMSISKAEASDDKTKMNITDFDVVPMLRDLLEEYERKNVNPNVTAGFVATVQSRMVHTDFARLHEIVRHLLSNAFKFTSRGTVTLTLDETDNGHLNISVADTGKGIPEEAYERIFDRFVKLDEFIQGAGLGLSVCRSYAYSLGGTVGVKSKEGEGSVFWVDIPAVLQM